MSECMTCKKTLTRLDENTYRKFVNRGARQFLCKSCLAEKLGVEETILDEKIEHFRRQGCSLFV